MSDIEDLEREIQQWCHCEDCVAFRNKAPKECPVDAEMQDVDTLAQAADYLVALAEQPEVKLDDLGDLRSYKFDDNCQQYYYVAGARRPGYTEERTYIPPFSTYSWGLAADLWANKRKHQEVGGEDESSACDFKRKAGYGFVDDEGTCDTITDAVAPSLDETPDSPALAGYLSDTDPMQF